MSLFDSEWFKAIPEEERAKAKEAIETAINTEKQLGITKYNEKDREVLGLKSLFKDTLGYDKEKHGSREEFLNSVKTKLSTFDETETNLQTVSARLKEVEGKFSSITAEREKEKADNIRNTILGKVTPKLASDYYSANALIERELDSGFWTLDDKGEVIAKNGDTVLSFDDSLKAFGEKYSDSRRNAQAGGNGDHGGKTEEPAKVENVDAIRARMGLN